ncbi:MAG: DUF4240 domain-containing protein [Armatimonadota bacterium]
MTNEAFWRIIAETRTLSDATMDGRVEALNNMLSKLPPEEIIQFDRIFREYMNQAYSYNLWGAAYIIGGGCSDDGFTDFRSWLISLGKETYVEALRNPESLLAIEFGPNAEEDSFFEEFAYVASEVYEQLTGEEMPATQVDYPAEPAGEPWDEDGDDLATRFPLLWAKFSEGD